MGLRGNPLRNEKVVPTYSIELEPLGFGKTRCKKMRKFTISTHNGGGKVSLKHNRRDRTITDHEPHIQKDGRFKVLIDSDPRELYDKLFSAAVDDYNKQQRDKGHSERQIDDYYGKIKKDRNKHDMYEMIVTVGNKDNQLPEEMLYKILIRFLNEWTKMYKNLVVAQAVYHADEVGVPHLHIVYVPVGVYDKGQKLRVSQNRALENLGYVNRSFRDTALVQWTKDQNMRLERICKELGIEIEHPRVDNQKHLETAEFKARQRIEEVEQQKENAIKEYNDLVDKHNAWFLLYFPPDKWRGCIRHPEYRG